MKKFHARRLIWFVLLNCIAFLAMSQSEDFRGGLMFSLNKKVNQRMDISGMAAVIFNQNLAELMNAGYDVGLGWKWNRQWKSEFHIRPLWRRNLENMYEGRTLIYHQITGLETFDKFSLAYRNRLQSTLQSPFDRDLNQQMVWHDRNRLLLRYKVNYYLQPYVMSEVFTPINHPRRKGIDQWRAGVGFVWQWSEKWRIDLLWQYIKPEQRAVDFRFFFLNAHLQYTFDQ